MCEHDKLLLYYGFMLKHSPNHVCKISFFEINNFGRNKN